MLHLDLAIEQWRPAAEAPGVLREACGAGGHCATNHKLSDCSATATSQPDAGGIFGQSQIDNHSERTGTRRTWISCFYPRSIGGRELCVCGLSFQGCFWSSVRSPAPAVRSIGWSAHCTALAIGLLGHPPRSLPTSAHNDDDDDEDATLHLICATASLFRSLT